MITIYNICYNLNLFNLDFKNNLELGINNKISIVIINIRKNIYKTIFITK